MTVNHHLLMPLVILTAGCSPTVPVTPLPEAAAFVPPADGFLEVTPLTVRDSSPRSWAWRVRTPDGSWKVISGLDAAPGALRATGHVQFPDGTKLTLPPEAVTLACSDNPREQDLEAWQDARGRILLRLSGGLTAFHSESVIAIDGHRLDGWWMRSMTGPNPYARRGEIRYEAVFGADGKQVVP